MKALKISALVAIAALMIGCNDSSSSDSNVTPSPEDPSIPLIPLDPILPTEPLEPEGEAETNMFMMATSTYPRTVMTGMISSKASDGNDTFEIWSHNELTPNWEPLKIAENVFYKGYIRLDSEKDNGGGDPVYPRNSDQQELEDISDLVIEDDSGRMVNLVMDESFVRFSKSPMKEEAFSRLKSITVVLEGAGSIMSNDRLSEVVALANQAIYHGVKFNVSMFASVDLEVLTNKRQNWKEFLEIDGVNVLPTSFDEMNKDTEIGYESLVLGNIIKFFGYDLETAFVKSPTYDENKKLLVYFGSARNGGSNTAVNRKGGDFNNMLMIDDYVADPVLTSEYNIAIKPHPKTAWIVDHYIPKYEQRASYFSSIPFELLALAAGKNMGLEHKIPEIDRVDSTYSTILFSVDKEKIHSIIDYSPSTGMVGSKDTVEFMRDNYVLHEGWGFGGQDDGEHYGELAVELRNQIDAPHIKVTNVHCYINDCPEDDHFHAQ